MDDDQGVDGRARGLVLRVPAQAVADEQPHRQPRGANVHRVGRGHHGASSPGGRAGALRKLHIHRPVELSDEAVRGQDGPPGLLCARHARARSALGHPRRAGRRGGSRDDGARGAADGDVLPHVLGPADGSRARDCRAEGGDEPRGRRQRREAQLAAPRDGRVALCFVVGHRRRKVPRLGVAHLRGVRAALPAAGRRLLGAEGRDRPARRRAQREDGVLLPRRDAQVPLAALRRRDGGASGRVRLQH
mmetsp:Transcript_12774/g.42926  ORF Transcript_12774/g.42926 Transcript_12774/m.42926 type:complete len:247 (+) Transcript_12774:741-1481(+)